jgi:hypothetical protein
MHKKNTQQKPNREVEQSLEDMDLWIQPDTFFVAELEMDSPINKKIPVISVKKTKKFVDVFSEEKLGFDFNQWENYSFHALKNTFKDIPYLILQMSFKSEPEITAFMLFSNMNESMMKLFQEKTDSVLFIYPSKINEICSIKCPFEWVEGSEESDIAFQKLTINV